MGYANKNMRLERAFMDGSNRVELVKNRLGIPMGITLDIVNKRIYWSDSHFDTVETVTYHGLDRWGCDQNFALQLWTEMHAPLVLDTHSMAALLQESHSQRSNPVPSSFWDHSVWKPRVVHWLDKDGCDESESLWWQQPSAALSHRKSTRSCCGFSPCSPAFWWGPKIQKTCDKSHDWWC